MEESTIKEIIRPKKLFITKIKMNPIIKKEKKYNKNNFK